MKKITHKTNKAEDLATSETDVNELKWEENNALIGNAIYKHLNQYGTMPSKALIAEATGLSRLTVHRHLETFTAHDIYKDERLSFGIMKHHVVSQVLRSAMRGDLKAAKLFLETSNQLEAAGKGTVNNYVQINKTVINQQVIQQLNPEQLEQIEKIVAQGLKVKEG